MGVSYDVMPKILHFLTFFKMLERCGNLLFGNFWLNHARVRPCKHSATTHTLFKLYSSEIWRAMSPSWRLKHFAMACSDLACLNTLGEDDFISDQLYQLRVKGLSTHFT